MLPPTTRTFRRQILRSPDVTEVNRSWWQQLDSLGESTPVFIGRPLPLDAVNGRFGDKWWDLGEALQQEHSPALKINWDGVGKNARAPLKVYAWTLLNYSPNEESRVEGGYKQLSPRTVVSAIAKLKFFMDYMAHLNKKLPELSAEEVDGFVDYEPLQSMTESSQLGALLEVRRLWSLRTILPTDMRLPIGPPWGGRSPSEIIGMEKSYDENATRRISENTIDLLLGWSLRFVEDFYADILDAAHAYNDLAKSRDKHVRRGTMSQATLRVRAENLVEKFRREGISLPGVVGDNGLELDRNHLGRLLNAYPHNVLTLSVREVLATSGLKVESNAAITAPPRVLLEGKPWLDASISYYEVDKLVNVLTAACLVVITYLSGMRPGEVLTLKRDCVERSTGGDMWVLTGRTFKGVRDEHGHVPGGVIRDVPWVVVEPVAKAVAVMERLHDLPNLFPARLLNSQRTRVRASLAVTPNQSIRLITRFIEWVNEYCRQQGRTDSIPEDAGGGKITLSRFRRTLAWHIYRKPRGLVGAAIQYGHVSTAVTLGYAGNAASGFPDDLAFERFLVKLETVNENHEYLQSQELVSGPSAELYRERTIAARAKFSGTVLKTGRQAAALLKNPELQVYQGQGMTCVPQMGKQMCRTLAQNGAEETPDLLDCRKGCQCKAYTDRDIADLRQRSEMLREIVEDESAPPFRVEREAQELRRIRKIIDNHDHLVHSHEG